MSPPGTLCPIRSQAAAAIVVEEERESGVTADPAEKQHVAVAPEPAAAAADHAARRGTLARRGMPTGRRCLPISSLLFTGLVTVATHSASFREPAQLLGTHQAHGHS